MVPKIGEQLQLVKYRPIPPTMDELLKAIISAKIADLQWKNALAEADTALHNANLVFLPAQEAKDAALLAFGKASKDLRLAQEFRNARAANSKARGNRVKLLNQELLKLKKKEEYGIDILATPKAAEILESIVAAKDVDAQSKAALEAADTGLNNANLAFVPVQEAKDAALAAFGKANKAFRLAQENRDKKAASAKARCNRVKLLKQDLFKLLKEEEGIDVKASPEVAELVESLISAKEDDLQSKSALEEAEKALTTANTSFVKAEKDFGKAQKDLRLAQENRNKKAAHAKARGNRVKLINKDILNLQKKGNESPEKSSVVRQLSTDFSGAFEDQKDRLSQEEKIKIAVNNCKAMGINFDDLAMYLKASSTTTAA